jgi:hypothetical protein
MAAHPFFGPCKHLIRESSGAQSPISAPRLQGLCATKISIEDAVAIAPCEGGPAVQPMTIPDAELRRRCLHAFATLARPWPSRLRSFAVGLPTLIAFNVAPRRPSSTRRPRTSAGGGFLLVLSMALSRDARPKAPAALALLGALALVVLSALAAPLWASLPWPLSLSAAGTVLSAVLAVAVGASVQRADLAGLPSAPSPSAWWSPVSRAAPSAHPGVRARPGRRRMAGLASIPAAPQATCASEPLSSLLLCRSSPSSGSASEDPPRVAALLRRSSSSTS